MHLHVVNIGLCGTIIHQRNSSSYPFQEEQILIDVRLMLQRNVGPAPIIVYRIKLIIPHAVKSITSEQTISCLIDPHAIFNVSTLKGYPQCIIM